MSVKKLSVIAVVCASIFAVASQAHVHENKAHQMRWIAKELELSRSQKQDLRAMMRQGMQDISVFHEDLKGLRSELQALVSSDDFQHASVVTIYESYRPTLLQMAQQKLQNFEQVQEILTASQQEKLSELLSSREQNGISDRMARRQGKMLTRLLDKLDIPEEDLDTINAVTNMVSKRWFVHSTKRDFFASLQVAAVNGVLEEDNFDTAFNAFYDALVEASIEAIEAARQTMPLLSAEQKAVLQEIASKRRFHRPRNGV